MKLPIVEIPHIFHVGNLDASGPQRRASNEGCLLSVSIYPEEWSDILNIKKGTTYQLQPADGAPLRLLDIKSISEEDQQALLARAQEDGLLTPVTMWKTYAYDSENEVWDEILFDTQTQAEEEAEMYADSPDFPGIHSSAEWKATPELTAYWHSRMTNQEPVLAYQSQDAAISLLVERSTNLDGIWWAEEYTPERNMVARGGLFQRAVSNLTRTPDPDISNIPDFGERTIEVSTLRIDAPGTALPLPMFASTSDQSRVLNR